MSATGLSSSLTRQLCMIRPTAASNSQLALVPSHPFISRPLVDPSRRILPRRFHSPSKHLFPSTSRLHLRSTAPTSLQSPLTSTSPFSTSSTMSSSSFLAAVNNRRTRYALNDKPEVSDARIEEILKTTVQQVPSSFNAQSSRYVVLLKDQHKKFWDIVGEVLAPLVTGDQKEGSEKRIAGFRAAYGTVLFYEDPAPVEEWTRRVPIYADHFPAWSEQTNAMNQFAVWTAFDAEGLGANLQHYNPLVDQRVASEWNVDLTWKLRAQLVFGGRVGDEPEPKPKEPVEKKLFIHGK